MEEKKNKASNSANKENSSGNGDLVNIVVLGDIGHSPRMNYHALSLAKEGFTVNLIGYSGSKPQKEVLSNPNIRITNLSAPPSCLNKLPTLLRFVFRVLWQAFSLLWSLGWSKVPKYLFLQNPPCVPALPICWFYCILTGAKLMIDWHNYGYTILALGLGEKHILVWIYRLVERVFGRVASAGICVSEAMKDDLKENWGVENITVHYDRPPSRFHPTTIEDQHDLFMKLSSSMPSLSGSSPDKTVFTERFADGRVSHCPDRPALLISSTSWTEDEDFSLLIDALSDYDKKAIESPNVFPPLIVIVTGKGPLKEYYLQLAKHSNWERIILESVWLEAEDYPRLLAAADMGVSLHTSSSGFDLPMKVVDMFGCGLPVIAQYYPTLDELVKQNVNGITFKSYDELTDRLLSWFKGFPHRQSHKQRLEKFKSNIEKFRAKQWHESWKLNVLPLVCTSLNKVDENSKKED